VRRSERQATRDTGFDQSAPQLGAVRGGQFRQDRLTRTAPLLKPLVAQLQK